MSDPLMPPLGVNDVRFEEPAPPPVPAMVDTIGVPPKNKLTPLGEEMQQEFLQQQSLTAVNLLRAVRKSPDDTARDLVVARDLGLPPNLVAGNKDLRAQAKAERIKADITGSPVLQRKYSDADFAAIAQDDSAAFSKLQDAIGSTVGYVMGATPSGGLPGLVGRAPRTALSGLHKMSLWGSAGTGRFASEVGAAGLQYLGAEEASKTLTKGAKSFAETAAWAKGELDVIAAENPSFTEAAVASGLQSVGQFAKYAPLMFTGPTGVLAAIGLMAVETGGITYSTDRAKNLSITRSAAHAAADATMEAAGEILLPGMKGFAKRLTGGAKVAELLWYSMFRESLGEVPTTLGQNFNEWLLVNPEKSAVDWAKEQPAAALSTVISTAVAGGVQTGASRGAVKFITEVMNREILSSESARQGNALEGMLKTALDVQTRTRSPEAFRAAVQEMAEATDGAATSVFVESANFEQLPPEDRALLPEAIREQIGASTESTLIEVPMSDVLTVAPGTPLEQFFTEHGKIGSPEALSRAEAKQASATAAEWLQSRADEIIQNAVDQEAAIAAHEKLVGSITTQISATGAFDEATNRSLARIAGSFYTAMGNHFGTSAVAMAQDSPLTVKTGGRTVVITDMGQTAPVVATLETFSAAGVGDLLKTSNWSVMTAENPGGQDAGSAANAAANAAMRKELVDAGYTVVDVQGSYGRKENSFVVLGITPKQALHYGQKYGQESVLAPPGLTYQDGTVTPAKGVTVHPAVPADFYTTLPDGTTFTVDLDFDAGKSQTLEQTTSVRRGRESLRKYGLKPGRRYTTRQVAAALEARQRAKWGSIDPKDRSPEAAAKIAKWMVAEVQFELENPEESGLGWYREKFQRGLDALSEIFPELKDDKQARDTMTAIIAIASDGQDVFNNVQQAVGVYQNFRAGGATEGKFTATRGSLNKAAIDTILTKFQEVYDRIGPERIHEYLMHEETVSELNKIARANGASVNNDYQAHLTMPMSTVVMGPKLGAFYANLMGSDKYLTMDRWWSRTFNRYRGTLVTAPTKAGLDWFRELLGQPELSDDETIAATIPYAVSYQGRGFKNGTEIEVAANTIYRAAFIELQDKPFGAKDRTFMLEAVAKAQQLLKRRGVPLPASEIQAILWYYEKRLYGDIGTRQTPYIDYSTTARRVVDELAPAVRGDTGGAPQDRTDAGREVPVGEESYGLEQPGPVAPTASYGEPHRNAVSVIGVHFGKSKSTTLHANRYGTGLKGAERARLAGESDLQNRIYFYVNEGSGVSPEAGVGPNARAVVLNNVYDSVADPLQIYTTDTNTFERAVMAAGFDGYYARGAFGKQGVAVLLGPHTVQTEELANPADAAGYPLPPATELSPIRQFHRGILEDSRLLFGLMKEADVKRLAPDLHQKMLDLGAKFDPKETYYRSDLAKLVPKPAGVLEQGSARATFNPEDLSITLTPDADFSTFNHEMSHFFLTVMSRLSQRADAPEALKSDMKILGDWFASKGGDFLVSEIARYHKNYEKRAVALEKSDPGSENAKAARRRADRTAAAYDYVVANGGGSVMVKASYNLGASVPEEFRLDITRPMQEAFAEAGARYFLEGKAPTKELRSVFRRFVKMATDAMRRLRQTIPLSDEVRGVFDRALGAEAAVQAAAERAGMAVDEAASDSATEKLRARSMRDLKWGVKARSAAIKALQKSTEAQRAATEDEVRADVEQRPLYRAIHWLRKGETTDPGTGDAVKVGKGFRLDARALVGMYPESGLNRPDLEKLKGMTQRDGLSPEIVAEMFGYRNGDALVRALTAAESIETVIENETNQRMLEEHGDLIDQKSIEDAANEAVHNELRRRQMANELKSQMEALATRRDTGRTTKAGSRVTVSILQEAAARFADSIIASVPLARLHDSAREHLAAEKAAAKRWQEAYTKTTGEKDPGVKPFQDAVKAKQDQLLHNSAAKAALEAISETNKTLKFFKYVLRDNNEKLVKNGRDPDIVNAARVLLSAYGLGGRKERISASYMELVKINDPTLYETLQAAVDTTDAVPVEELTFPELQELHANVEALWHLAKRSREVEIEGKKIALEEATVPLAERLDEIGVPERIPGEKWAVTQGEKRRSVLKFARALHARMEQWVEGIDGRYGGPFRKFVYQPIKTAADNFRAEKIQRLKELEALGRALSPHIRRGSIAAPELGYEFGRGKGEMGISELLHAILHTGNESNKRKLLLGREWGSAREDGSLDTSKWDGFIDRLIKEGALKKEHFDYAQGVWDLLESTKAKAQQAHREVFGRYFDEVTAQSFETPWGTYRGGYVPAKADPRLAKDADLRALAEREKDNMRFILPTTQKGFTKTRVEYNVPLLLDLTSLSQHIHQVMLFSHMEAAGRDVSKILRAGEVSGRLSRINEKAIPELITPWLNGSVKQLVSTPTVGDQSMARVANVVRMRTAMSFMFANVSNVLQQPSGFLTAWAKLHSDNLRSDMLRATATYLSNPRQLSAEVANQSQFMADRMAHEIYSMNDTIEKVLLDPSLYETATRWTTQHAYFLQAALEKVMGPIIWTAGYNGHYAKHGNETEAVQYADSLIRQTLGSSLPEDISRLERSNAYVKPFVMFFGYFSMLANTNVAMVQKTVDELGVRKGAGKSIGLVTVGGLAALWFAEAVTVMMRGGPEDPDDDGYLDDWILAVMGLGTTKGVTAMVPFIGQAVNAGFNTWNDKPYDDRMSVSPVVAALEALVRTPVSVYKAIAGEGKVKKVVNDLSSALTILTGLPIAGVTRGVGYAAGMAEDEIVPTSGVDLVRGLIQGSVSPESRVR